MIKVGIDLIKISRMKEILKNHETVRRIFNESEIENQDSKTLAGIFTLKEAFFKAAQIKIKKWNEVTIKKDENGKPFIIYDKNLVKFKISSIDCSLSHDGDYVIGIVIILSEQKD